MELLVSRAVRMHRRVVAAAALDLGWADLAVGGGEEKKMVMVYFGRMWSLACCSRVRHKTNGSSDPESEEGPVQIPGVSKPGNRPIVSTSALFLYVGLDVPRRDAI